MEPAVAPAPMPSSAPTYAAVRALVDAMARAGLRDVCVAPGARSTPLALVVAHDPRLRVWSHLDERSAAFFALGLGRATRRPAAVVCTSGTAAANFLPAVVEAAQARVPLLLLTADRPPELRDCGAFQAIDQLALFGRYAKWFCEVGEPSAGRAYFHAVGSRAVAVAGAAPPGPVHLNLPLREPLGPDDPRALLPDSTDVAPPPTALLTPGRLPDLDALDAALSVSARGVIVCGPLDADGETRAAIAALAAARGWPLLADATAQLRDGDHDRSHVIAAYDALLRDAATARRLAPAVVLRIGPLPISKALLTWLRDLPDCRQVVVDPSAGWDDPLQRATAIAHADVAPLCRALAARGGLAREPRWLAAWRRADAAATAAVARQLAADDACFEGSVVAALAAELPAGATLMVGNSMATRDLDTFWSGAERAVRVLCNRGANGIDGFVSTALGVAAASPGPTVALTGDLGFLHDLGGLLAAARHALRAVFVVCNNDGGGIFSYLPQADGSPAFERLFRTPHGLDLRGGVEMYGCAFRRATSRDAVAAALRAALAAPGVTVIEVPIALAGSVARHRRIWAAAGAAARAALAGSDPPARAGVPRALAANGVRYAVREWGDGPPLLLLHGFTGSGALWEEHARRLAARFHVVAPDLLGHGDSDAPADAARYAMRRAVDDLAALLDALALERVHLLGYSLGGRLALAFAVEQPARVASLILEGASPGIADADERAARRAADAQLAERLERDGLPAFVDVWMAQPLFATQARLSPAARAAARAARLRQRPAGLAGALRGIGAGSQPSYWHRLHELAMPVLLLAGAHDARFQAIARAMRARIPQAVSRIVPDAGHTTHLENPAAFQRLVRDFLAAADAAPSLSAAG
ncbi:2-succinyl-5-enolpyruvyl-6-hydroxy-3-cyclohexene-1-carboxylic-acid synthase [bacterium]|nr:2-succinyl-5-enolpyruvyl-6-hydroxy-3-cyclohexene-1-carboxylic-acid synthase [bacterium]